MKTVWDYFLKTQLLYDPTILPLSIYPRLIKAYVYTNTYTPIFTKAIIFPRKILEIANILHVIRIVFYLKKDIQNFKDILGAKRVGKSQPKHPNMGKIRGNSRKENKQKYRQ